MRSGSHLADLYESVFGVLPSSTSTLSLVRMEQALKLKEGDTFSRMIIVLLRCSDQLDETRIELQATVDATAPLIASARTLVAELDWTAREAAKGNRGIPSEDRVRLLDTYRKASPMVSYLGHAFRLRSGHQPLERNERIGAARYDLAVLVAVLLMAMGAGAVLWRAFHGW